MRRALLIVLLVLVVLGAAGWYYQSQVIGTAAEWYLGRVARSENANGSVEKRREILSQLNRTLLMPAPPDTMVPELFDLVTLLSKRVATGEVSLNWGAYIYTAYLRDLLRDRPTGMPRRTPEEVQTQLAQYIQFYAIQKRPEVQGVTVKDLMGTGDDVISLDEIKEAEKSGKEIDLRTRGAK